MSTKYKSLQVVYLTKMKDCNCSNMSQGVDNTCTHCGGQINNSLTQTK